MNKFWLSSWPHLTMPEDAWPARLGVFDFCDRLSLSAVLFIILRYTTHLSSTFFLLSEQFCPLLWYGSKQTLFLAMIAPQMLQLKLVCQLRLHLQWTVSIFLSQHLSLVTDTPYSVRINSHWLIAGDWAYWATTESSAVATLPSIWYNHHLPGWLEISLQRWTSLSLRKSEAIWITVCPCLHSQPHIV